jgi:hypothetical protein
VSAAKAILGTPTAMTKAMATNAATKAPEPDNTSPCISVCNTHSPYKFIPPPHN